MVLTIGMIVKNEEKWLDKCLSAIKPILDHVDSELIITDTGSTDRTVEIARKYTNNVLHFDWINDFSAARNYGLKKAHGKWFMMIDADEIFQSCNGIIHFFNSEEYTKYNSATFIIRNLHESNSSKGSDFVARRMSKICPDTVFNGVIHEHLSAFIPPVKNLEDIAFHYGYVYDQEQQRIKKFERNYDLLMKKYEACKDENPMIYAEIYDNFATGFKQKEADEFLKMGIDWCEKHEHPLLVLMYCKKARHLLFEKQNKEALEICEKYLRLGKKIRPDRLFSDIEIYAIMATVFYRIKDYSKNIDTLVTVLKYYDDIRSNVLNTPDKMYGAVSLASNYNYISYVGQFLDSCISSGKYEKAAEYISTLPIGEYPEDRETYLMVIALEAELIEKVGVQYIEIFGRQLDDFGKKELIKRTKYFSDVAKTRPESEMLQLSMMLKNNIRNMILNDNKESARKYLDEYSEMMPEDSEISDIRKLLEDK